MTSSISTPEQLQQQERASERKSYVEYINNRNVHPTPIDPNSPTQLFDIISEGVLLWYVPLIIDYLFLLELIITFCSKLINQVAPGTINEKYIITKPGKSRFEMNINNDIAIKGAKELGCTIVNIGGDDISSGNPSLILGVLWQIIKVL